VVRRRRRRRSGHIRRPSGNVWAHDAGEKPGGDMTEKQV